MCALLCMAMFAASCGEPPKAAASDTAPPTPPPLASAATTPHIGVVHFPPPVRGAATPRELMSSALRTCNDEVWPRKFRDWLHTREIYIADAVALERTINSRDYWRFNVVRALGPDAAARPAETLTACVHGAPTLRKGDRWVLLGTWQKTGFGVMAAWTHSDAVEAGIVHLRATLDALADGACSREPKAWGRVFVRELPRCHVWVCRAFAPVPTAPKAGPESRWRLQIDEVLHGSGRPGPETWRLPSDLTSGLENGDPVIVVGAGHGTDWGVKCWWYASVETRGLLRWILAASHR